MPEAARPRRQHRAHRRDYADGERKRGILDAAQLLGNAPAQADEAVEAIMTSDTRPKQIAVEFKLGGKTVRIGGICKGAGMIQPGMSATGARPAAHAAARHDALLHHHRRRYRSEGVASRVAGSRREQFQPHHRGWRHEHQRHGAGAGQRTCWKQKACGASVPRAGSSELRSNVMWQLSSPRSTTSALNSPR